jgi:hypothetical protein
MPVKSTKSKPTNLGATLPAEVHPPVVHARYGGLGTVDNTSNGTYSSQPSLMLIVQLLYLSHHCLLTTCPLHILLGRLNCTHIHNQDNLYYLFEK